MDRRNQLGTGKSELDGKMLLFAPAWICELVPHHNVLIPL